MEEKTVVFNEAQQSVVDLSDGWHACQAPAGSGKTEILTERVRKALEDGLPPSKMLCITFTNRAARSMIERVTARMGERTKNVFIGNTHAFALRFLEENGCLPRTASLIEASTETTLWKNAHKRTKERLRDLGDDACQEILAPFIKRLESLIQAPFNATSKHIERVFWYAEKTEWDAWNLRSIASLLKTVLDPRLPPNIDSLREHTKSRLQVVDANISENDLGLASALALMIWDQYEQEKRELAFYDFDDLLVLAYKKLSSPEPCKLRGFTWAQIDEAQDLSPIQWMILKAALAPNAHVLLLGDLAQSIYRFLGASIEVTEHEFGHSIYTLSENYRSPANLVNAANILRSTFLGDSSISTSVHPTNPTAMVLVTRRFETETRDLLIKHAYKVTRIDNINAAFLCPSNQGVTNCSDSLAAKGIDHFTVGKNDLFTKRPALDFLAFISVLHNPRNRLAWSRLFWRFGDLSKIPLAERNNYPPLLASAHLSAKLAKNGSELRDFLVPDVKHHYLAQFLNHANRTVTYFDTETTGLDPNKDSIIQLAGVKIKRGEVRKEIDLYCKTNTPLGNSVEVHGITPDILNEKGKEIESQIYHFLQFNASRPLVAHNLPFDDAMLRHHLKKHFPQAYSAYKKLPKYCTLDLARRFFPELPSHKLGWLLTHFGLEGENSHNALDDVKAGSALMAKLAETAESHLVEISEITKPYADSLQRFSDRFSTLYAQATEMIQDEVEVNIKNLIDLYFSHVEKLSNIDYDDVDKKELITKLIRHAEQSFEPAPLRDYLQVAMPFYQTAKESDLITKLDRLVVSTIHRSKGLEFDCVLIPNAVEASIPSYRIMEQCKSHSEKHAEEGRHLLKEQARLFYVAFTRAKHQVVVGSHRKQMIKGKTFDRYLTRYMNPIVAFFEKY
ncbi:UvrD-helicase domain-containing protein [Marinobacter salinisoli]|uniref:DNA 3'-5' helicase n=1 Tax=Marinobacter salinisoli TaxID=2769486 RepID=A0ABX7MSB9_9GAMM|nr:UvrD-helicase domain-containing protein [Marinobacter salinisoli]QSP94001.1 UvrD-helicase domain-containing protein [Marinobacter salinisoli]